MTRQFIRAEYKDKKGQWHIIPLSVTDADTDGQEEEEAEVKNKRATYAFPKEDKSNTPRIC